MAGGRPPGTAVTFPDTDIAAVARGYGLDAVTVRTPDDLSAVRRRVNGPRDRALLDAEVAAPPRLLVARGGLPRPLTVWRVRGTNEPGYRVSFVSSPG